MADFFTSQTGAGVPDGLTPETAWAIATVNWTTCSGENLYGLDIITNTVFPGVSGVSLAQKTIFRGDYTGRESDLISNQFHGIDIQTGIDNVHVYNFRKIQPEVGRVVRILGACSGIEVSYNIMPQGIEGAAGIDYDGNGSDLNIHDNSFNNSGFDSINVRTDGSGDLTTIDASDNTISNSNRHAIIIGPDQLTDVNTMTGISVLRNVIDTTGIALVNPAWINGAGIWINRNTIDAGARISNVDISYNEISNTGGIGIFVTISDDINITHNTLLTTSTKSNGQGIGAYGCTNFRISNNYIDGVDSDDLVFDGHGIDLDYIEDEAAAGTYYVDDTGIVQTNVIKNAFAGTRTPGINMLSNQNVEVSCNLIDNCTNGFKIGLRGGTGTTAEKWPQGNLNYNQTIVAGDDGKLNGLLIQNTTVAEQALENTNEYGNLIIVGWDTGVHVEGGDGDLNNFDSICYFNNKADELHEGTGAINSTNIITSDPLFVDMENGNYNLQKESPCVGVGVKWWGLDPRPESLSGEPLPDVKIDLGAYQTTFDPNHPVNL